MDEGADYRQQQELEELQQWLLENEGKEICIYCFNPRNGKISCCGENHFEEVKNDRKRDDNKRNIRSTETPF